jgi:hypothetical protein
MVTYYRSAAGVWTFWRAQPIPAAADWNHVTWLTPPLPAGATAVGVGFSLLSTGTATMDDLSLNDADAKIEQTISFTAPTGVREGDPDFDLGATASSGLPVVYTSQTPGVCTIVSGLLHVVDAGSCTIDADQPGDDYYNPAPQVERTWNIARLGYPRPKAATPTRIPLVIAYGECGSANRAHAAPLSFGSCAPPQRTSAHLTAGTPDANASVANSVGLVSYVVTPGDLNISFSLDDVRRETDLSDYTGELRAVQTMRITDLLNPEDEPGTVADTDFAYTVPCTATASTTIGASCGLATSANSLTPGMASAGSRAIWELGQLRVLDGGADGLGATGPNTLFADQGIFVP